MLLDEQPSSKRGSASELQPKSADFSAFSTKKPARVSAILDIVLPIFGVMVIGYGAARLGYFGEHACGVLTRFVFNFSIPAMLFRSLAATALPPALPWETLLSYYLSAFACMAVGMAAGRLIQGRSLDGQTIVGLNAGFGNAVLIGLPLALSALGDAATLPLFLIIAFHSTILVSLGTLLIEIDAIATFDT